MTQKFAKTATNDTPISRSGAAEVTRPAGWDLDLAAAARKRWVPLDYYRNPELSYVRFLRWAESAKHSDRSWLGKVQSAVTRFWLARYSMVTGISIPPGTFAEGLSIAHYGSIVVSDRAKIGKFCRIHSATNIGERDGRAPTLGNFVYIGPGAVLSGDIKVGDRAVVGANSVVLTDVAGGVTVAGAPARVISNAGSEAIMPAWIAGLMNGH